MFSLILCIFIILIFLSAFLNSPKGKGIIGEFCINMMAKIYLDRNVYHLIKDVTLPTDMGTTQIDHIIVSKYGLFVVETKNMRGWIFGTINDKKWTQKIYKKNYSFQNPLNQNYKHIKTISDLIGVDNSKIFSVIVFVGDSNFKTEMPYNVTYGSGYINFIKAKTEILFKEIEVKSIVCKLNRIKIKRGNSTDRKHVEHLQSIHSIKPSKRSRGDLISSRGIAMVLLGSGFFVIAWTSISMVSNSGSSARKISENLLGSTTKILSVKASKTSTIDSIIHKSSDDIAEYMFSNIQVEEAKKDLLKPKRQIFFSQVQSGDTEEIISKTQHEKLELLAKKYLYEIKFISGKIFTSENLVIGANRVTFINKNGLLVSINSSEVESIDRLILP